MRAKIRDIFHNREFVFIAEIGINHNGDVESACRLVEAAAKAGADAVKFQTFVSEKMFSSFGKSLLEGASQPYRDNAQIDFFKKLTLNKDEYDLIANFARNKNTIFFSSVFDDESLDLLENLNVPLYKIASSEVTNIPLLSSIGKTGKPVILSTGICTEKEIECAIDLLNKNGTPDIVLLHCVSLYPLPLENANLLRIKSLRKRFGLEVGFSDHSADFSAVKAAVALGARIIEKHFTLGSDYSCPDAPVSLNPEQFIEMRKECEKVSLMLGDGTIDFDNSQKDVAKSARRSLYAKTFIPSGKKIDMSDIALKRPGVGIDPMGVEVILGKRAVVDIEEDSLLKMEFFA